jgi:predicted metal-dependent hydrolase
MNKEIIFNDHKISYNLRKSRRSRNIRITIQCDGNCIVSAPLWASNSSIERFIFEKARWIFDKVDVFKKSGIGEKRLLMINNKKDYSKNKEKALMFIRNRLNHFNGFYGFNFKKISVRNQKTRWGSCSKAGNLNFNYKIILLPERLADYIIVHEICHLGEFNHSRDFWNLVAKTFPDYREIIRELRKFQTG